MFHLKTRIELPGGSYIDISTIEVPQPLGGGFETCIFLSDGEGSEVCETYGSAEEAAEGHTVWSRRSVAFYVRNSILEVRH